jgi:hypothetical protein
MEDTIFEAYKARVYAKLTEINKDVIPPTWWDTVIKHYYNQGYSEERAVRSIMETMNK